MKRKIISLVLTLSLLMSMFPTRMAATASTPVLSVSDVTGLCPHHTKHTEDCGYIAESDGSPCTHEHTEDCFVLTEDCEHEHTEDCAEECAHEHTENCYVLTENCTHVHTEDCGYTEAVEGHLCEYNCDICQKETETEQEKTDADQETIDRDQWIEEKLRAIEDQYNSGIMPLAFVEGYIPWEQYFTVYGLPSTISETKWLDDCKNVSLQGYNVDNTGVKYTKFPQYDNAGVHFTNVTLNGVEVVRVGILMPDDNQDGTPVYYYMTQKHVDSDSSDGSGSHTGSISALLLPENAKFQVNYAVNDYKFSYEIQLNGENVTNDKVNPEDENSLTWEQTIFNGLNPSSSTGGAVSFDVTIPYGYTAQIYRYVEYDEDTDTWIDKTPFELTGKRSDRSENEWINEGCPLGTEPEYEIEDGKSVQLKSGSPSAKRMSATIYDDHVTENRHIVVKLIPDTKLPIFDAHLWLGTANAGNRATTGSALDRKEHDGNVDSEDGWSWDGDSSAFKYDPRNNPQKDKYDKHWYKNEDDETWSLYWIFQTNNSDSYVLNSLELNGTYIDIPFRPMYTIHNYKVNESREDVLNDSKLGTSVTTATLPDGAQVKLTFYREFGSNADPKYQQRVYILEITGARSNITVTNGNLMQYRGGGAEYVATVMSGVTAENNESDTFGYYGVNVKGAPLDWYTQPKTLIQVQEDNSTTTCYTKFEGDPEHYYANLRFKLQSGYEDPYFIWEDRMTATELESSYGKEVVPWDEVSQHLTDEKLETGYIYGPVTEEGQEWYYIRIGTPAKDGNNGRKMCVLTLKASATKYMVRYMVGDAVIEDDPTNRPEDDNVENMPEFSTADNTWDEGLRDKEEGGIAGKYITRYDDNYGNFYDRQNFPVIPVSDKEPTTKDGSKFFQYWVVVDKDENIIPQKDAQGNDMYDEDGKPVPIIVKPNTVLNLVDFDQYAVDLSKDIGGTDNNYYVIRLKGVWTDTPTDFEFYIRMVWTDEETGKSHVMDLVQNVTTSVNDPNMTEDGCLIVTVNTVTDTFKNWFTLHPFYAYDTRNFISTKNRQDDWLKIDDAYILDSKGNPWEAYPEEFTDGSIETIQEPNAYYRVEQGDNGTVQYVVQRYGTIVLYLEQVNGQLPVTKTIVGADSGTDEFTYTITAKLLPDDIKRSELEAGVDPEYLSPESLMNMLPNGTFFGMAPDATMTELKDFTGKELNIHFTRYAPYTPGKLDEVTVEDMEKWYSTATFTLKGGEATILSVPQARYTIVEEKGNNNFQYDVVVNKQPSQEREAIQDVKIGKVTGAVNFENMVHPGSCGLDILATISGDNAPNATFDYELALVKGSDSQVSYDTDGVSITTSNGSGANEFGEITFYHAGTYEFLVMEELKSNVEGTISPASSTRSVTVVVENINGQLTITKVTVDGTTYNNGKGVVIFPHTFIPPVPDTVRVTPRVYKILNGRSLLPSVFEFELSYDGKTYTATNNAAANGKEGSVLFDPIDFTKEGKYTVTVTEKPGDQTSIDYDNRTITITYTVENVDNALKVTDTKYSGGQGADNDTFINQAYADASFDVVKNYDLSKRPGGEWENDTFEITAKLMSAPAGNHLVKYNAGYTNGLNIGESASVVLSKTNKTDKFDFRFFSEGVYTFEVRETKGNLPGVSYDGGVYYVTVTVAADGEILKSSVSITKNNKVVTGNKVTFDNKFDPGYVDVSVNAKKVLLNGYGETANLAAGRFRFQLRAAGAQTGGLVASNDASGNVTFTLQNLSIGEYEYSLYEINDKETGVNYDETKYTVKVKVEIKPGDSAASYTVTYYDETGKEVTPIFRNSLKLYGQLAVSNTVTGTKAAQDATAKEKEFTYTFTFKDEQGTEITEPFSYELQSNNSSVAGLGLMKMISSVVMPLFAPGSTPTTGTITSGGSIELRDGQTILIRGLLKGTTFTVVESDYDDYVVSHDGTEGDTEATAVGEIIDGLTKVNYTNTLDLTPPNVTITKTQSLNGNENTPLIVKEGDEVTYTLTVTNEGETTAENVTITDLVPEGLTIKDINNNGTEADGKITWTISELEYEESTEVSFTVTVPRIDQEETWENTASVTWDDTDTVNQSNSVTLNASPLGKLTVSNTVGENGNTEKEFTYTVELSDKTISGTYGGMTFVNGTATFTLKHGKSLTATDLPAGVTFTVTESDNDGYIVSPESVTGTIEANVTSKADFINTPTKLTISKTVAGSKGDKDQEWSFTVTLTGNDLVNLTEDDVIFSGDYSGTPGFNGSTITFKLKHGESINIHGLPIGTAYTITEAEANKGGYGTTVTDNGNGILPQDGNAMVSVVNANPAGGVYITKTVENALTSDAGTEFEFAVNLTAPNGTTLLGSYTYTDATTGDNKHVGGILTKQGDGSSYGTIKLQPGQSIYIEGLPAGTTVQVTETGPTDQLDDFDTTITVTDANDNTREVSNRTVSESVPGESDGGAQSLAIMFLNTRKTGGLTLNKTIEFPDGNIDTDKEFTFTVKLSDKAINGTYGDMTFVDGEATVILKHDESMTATDLPVGVGYTVTEEEADGYTPSLSNDQGTIEADETITVSAVNTYKLESETIAGPKITKVLTGRTLKAGEFTFEISSDATEGIILPGSATNDEKGNVQFADITFTKTGIYTVTIKEKVPEGINEDNVKDGVEYDTHEITLTYTVVDNGDGTMKVTGPTVTGNTTFTNIYTAKSVSAAPTVKKELNYGTLTDGQFEFVMEVTGPANGWSYEDGNIAQNDADGTVRFGNIIFSEVGTYIVTIKENVPDTLNEENTKDGIKYDTHKVTFTYEVKDDGNGNLYIDGNPKVDGSDIFTNEEIGNLTVSKKVTGSAGEMDRAFNFTVELSDTTIRGTYGDMTFIDGIATITLKHGESKTATGLPASVVYTVTELEANQDGYITTITDDNARGIVTASGVTVAFVNDKTGAAVVNLNGTKHYNGTLSGDDFEFELIATSGDAPMPDKTTTRNKADGTFTFNPIIFDAVGTYIYEIKEVNDNKSNVIYDDTVYTATIEVTDIGGELSADVTYSIGDMPVQNVEFTNAVYSILVVTNNVNGNAADPNKDFTYTVYLNDAIDGTTVTYGDMTFVNGIATFTLKSGEKKTALLPVGTRVKVVESDYEDYRVSPESKEFTGTMEAGKPFDAAFTNTRNIPDPGTVEAGRLTVTKTVTGNSGETNRAFHFTVSIDGATYDLYLKHGESWTSGWYPTGTVYSVVEDDYTEDGYTTTVSGNAAGMMEGDQTIVVEFVNDKDTPVIDPEPKPEPKPEPDPEPEPKPVPDPEPIVPSPNPNTGDDSPIGLWTILMILSLAGVVVTRFSKRKIK